MSLVNDGDDPLPNVCTSAEATGADDDVGKWKEAYKQMTMMDLTSQESRRASNVK